MNLTDNEIIKALECCLRGDCSWCIRKRQGVGLVQCRKEMQKDTIDLINRQKAEIEKFEKIDHFAQKTIALQTAEIKKLEAEVEELQLKISSCNSENAESKAEIERLYAEGLQINKTFMDFVNKCKAEAIKEFAERLKKKSKKRVSDIYGKRIFVEDIDNLVKKTVGD